MNNNYKDEQNDRFQNLEGDFIAPQALDMPSLTRDAIDPNAQDDIEQHYDENNRMPSLAGGYQQDPLLMGADYHDDFEQPIQDVEEGQLPSLPSLNNRRLS